jgi:hypothetical protein
MTRIWSPFRLGKDWRTGRGKEGGERNDEDKERGIKGGAAVKKKRRGVASRRKHFNPYFRYPAYGWLSFLRISFS